MEKQIHITKLNAKYNKDFDTFGKMDPFLVFKIGKTQTKTETANSQGKTPNWNTPIIFKYFDQATINIESYEEDNMSNDYMGAGTINLKTLESSGVLQIKIEDKGQLIGTVFGQYSIKTLAPSPFLIIKNIKCDFYKQTKFILKAKSYFSLGCGSNNMITDVCQQSSGKKLFWNENLRVKMNQNNSIILSLLDKDNNGNELFKYECNTKQFNCITGKKSFYVNDSTFEPLGILQFQYETLNNVNKQESAKNEQKSKQQENIMAKISIQKIRGNLLKSGIDVYFKILCGPNMVMTNAINSAPKNFEMINQNVFYAQSKENKITFAMWDKNFISDEVIGFGSLILPATNGEKQVLLKNKNGEAQGSIFVMISSVQTITAKSICFEDIKLNLLVKGDIIGSSQPYIIGRIGGWSGRTETAQGQTVSFKKSLNLKFNDEDKVNFQIWDEDIMSNDKLCQQSYNLSELKSQSGQITIPLGQNKGQLKMKYTTKNVQYSKKVESPIKISQQSKRQSINKTESPQKKQQDSNRSNNNKNESFLQKPESKRSKMIQQSTINQKQQTNRQSIKKETQRQVSVTQKVQMKQQNPNNQQKKPTERQKMPIVNQQINKENYNDNNSLNQSNINRSKNTFKLPVIENRNFGDRIFDKQSSSTLQKSIHVYSIPKANRFGQGPKYAGEPSYYVETSFKNGSGKGAGFGFGNKRQFPEWLQKNMKENPAPGSYFETRNNITESYRSKGPTFGIAHKYYQKVMIPKEKSMIQKSLERIHKINR